ncbi:hypothetical protein BDN70DRAFT_108328 [Pholiota conissans]|uniref:Uncharacterized protein n=1 Tax=Pholiota conissans TaxID=109636 RepID=A0A9P5ZBI6_9AGAR|nr:hypothetical protein BDN70DRAFT_108328 [Pholiota conissans]
MGYEEFYCILHRKRNTSKNKHKLLRKPRKDNHHRHQRRRPYAYVELAVSQNLPKKETLSLVSPHATYAPYKRSRGKIRHVKPGSSVWLPCLLGNASKKICLIRFPNSSVPFMKPSLSQPPSSRTSSAAQRLPGRVATAPELDGPLAGYAKLKQKP